MIKHGHGCKILFIFLHKWLQRVLVQMKNQIYAIHGQTLKELRHK